LETLTDLDKLRYYRDEVKHEFSLLAMRTNILVTSQSFLVVPFAILNTVGNFRTALASVYLVAVLGIFVTIVLIAPMHASHKTIEKWLQKNRLLIKNSNTLQDLTIDRDLIPDVEKDLSLDRDHYRSLAFSRSSPWAFFVFWILASIAATIRACIGV
jgi:hypothetical protein